MRKLNKLFAMLVAMLGVGTLSAQTDVTSTYLTNAGFESVDGWTIVVDQVGEKYTGSYYKLDTSTDPNTIEVYHTWAASSAQLNQAKNFKFSQTVTLPAGEYRLKVNGFYREGAQQNATTDKAWAFAGENKQNLVGIGTCGANSMSDAAAVFKNGGCLNEFDFTVTEEQTIEIGFQGYINTSLSWVILGPVSLLQYSMDDFNNELIAARTKLQGVTGLNAAMTAKVETVLSETESVTQTKAVILEATAKVNAMYDEAIIMQTAISGANASIAACESMLTNSTADDKSVFSTAISTAKSNLDTAEDETAIASLLSTLNEAKNAYCLVAAPAEGYPFDMTHLVVNPQFDEGTTGWAFNTGAPNYGIATNQGGAITGKFFENWKWESYTGEIYQELTNLPKGKYKLTAAAFRDQLIEGGSDADAVYVFANEETTLVNSATPAFYSVEVSTTTGTIRFGVQSKVALYRWMGIDNVSLQFIERLDLSEFIAAYNTALEAAEAARDNAEYSNITGVERSNLLNAIANVPEEAQEPLAEAAMALQSVTEVFIAAKDDYDLLDIEKLTAEGLGMSDENIEETITGKTGLVALQDLKEAEYVFVMENFNYPVALSDTWNSTGTNTEAATFNNEHWSGTIRDYKNQKDGTGMGWQASAWTIDFDQEVTLPAGKYVFKVAGRKSADATLSLVVTQGETTLGTVNDFPSSNNSVGINKAGATSFDANDAAGFANNGNGFGWQWRYVMFVLDAEATVKVAVHAETSMIHNWVSFGDYTLQMTEETYLEANKGGVEVAEAAAQALVDTTPMGDAENEALKAALAMTYTTGAEMLAKIEALETAVANANAWVTAYNEAKAPLVAALERFEADYNDGENGAKDHMAKSRWETVLAMVQTAAEAKDVTNSYEGFAAATENLVDALDAATVSVNEYAALDEAIKAATALANGINWGDEPFQRPESAKAGLDTADEQAVYDAAESDGEGVTALTEALNAAVETANNVTLNAPAEGDAFYITVATEGHSLFGNYIVASLGTTGVNNPTGYGLNASVDNTYNPFTKVYTFEQVEGNNYRISVKVNAETVYLTVGSLNGSAAGWNQQQIQGTTDVAKAAEFEVEASTSKSGVIRLRNTVYDNYLDCQAGGSIYTDTDINNEDFALTLAEGLSASVAINISEEIKLSTCVLMFDAQLPAELEAYVGVSVENDCLILQKVEGVLPAYTPCLLYAETGYEGTLEGTVEWDSYNDTIAVGDFLRGAIDKSIIADGYVLQNQNGEGGNGLGFYVVNAEKPKTIPVGKCWLSVPQSSDTEVTPASVGLRFINGGATKLNPVLMDKAVLDGAIYTIDGKRVNSMERGQIYIISGQKVMIK